ncbi:glutaminyl-peptide cyclotransferase [Gemmatimonas sp.]|uniref:glutaminyl-peptide cyclotransferase n=1 Tax=Gemmatimonas sp. TaxID=1962908 RepID=UPI003983679B
MTRGVSARWWSMAVTMAFVTACGGGDSGATPGARPTLPSGMMAAAVTNADGSAPAVPFATSTPVVRPTVLERFPHDSLAYTQGLLLDGKRLFESTGLEGQSEVREVALRTGRVIRHTATPDAAFGEGIAVLNDRLYQLTWRRGRGTVYSPAGLRVIDSVRYDGEGWGLATDGSSLYQSDGTSIVRVLEPKTFTVMRTFDVREAGQPVRWLNELEWVNDELWANVYQTNFIARIDPTSGTVKGWVDVSALLTSDERTFVGVRGGTANGIAYDRARDMVLLTGKLWPWLFVVTVPR